MAQKDLDNLIGLGIAGNFTGHLEQAGEASDFEKVEVFEELAPKGIFPYYVPHFKGFLGTNPTSQSEIKMAEGNFNLQPEPEVALLCDLVYKNQQVVELTPKQFTAFNDCSIRKDAKKISEKKNWGLATQGASNTFIAMDSLKPGGTLDNYNISCFLKRNGKIHVYGVDSPISNYTYFHQKLLDWIIDRLNNQKDGGPLEDISELLAASKFPKQALITIGATRYTNYGETTYLEVGDLIYVVVYNSKLYNANAIKDFIEREKLPNKGLSLLKQRVVS